VLDAALADLTTGRGGVVALQAPAGLGKTALLQAVRDRARELGFLVLSARGGVTERDFSFGVVRQLVQPLTARAGPDRSGPAGTVARLLADLMAGSAPWPQESPYPVLDALYRLVVNVSAAERTVLLVDDVHWADEPSARFLGFLARRIGSLPVAMVVTSWSDGQVQDESLDQIVEPGVTRTLEPKRLSSQAAAQLVRHGFGAEASGDFCAVCYALTGGSPLFLTELIRLLAEAGAHPDAAGVTMVRARGPDVLRRHVASRLRRHHQDARGLARAVAVLGDHVPLGLAASACGLSPSSAASAAGRLVCDAVFDQADPPSFIHPSVRETVLTAEPLGWHDDYLDKLDDALAESGTQAVRTAAQLLRAAPAGRPERVAVLLEAAEQAWLLGSPRGAAVFLRRARDEPPPRGLRAEVCRLLGICQAGSLAIEDADRSLREAVKLAEPGPQRAWCAYALALLRAACGAPGEAVDLLAGAIGELAVTGQGTDRDGQDLAACLAAELAGTARADLSRAQELPGYLRSMLARPDVPAPVVNAHLALAAVFEGRPVHDGALLARRALAGAGLPPQGSAFWTAIQVLIITDCLDEAEASLRNVLGTSLRTGMLAPLSLAHAYLARVAYLRGDIALAEEQVAAGASGAVKPSEALPVLDATRIELLVQAGQLDRAEALIEQGALAQGRRPGTAAQLWLLGARTQLRIALGDSAAALADATMCGQLYRQWGAELVLDVPWRLQAATACLRMGDAARAAWFADEQLRLARAARAARPLGMALRTAAEIADWDITLLAEAVTALERTSASLELVLTLEQWGRALTRAGQQAKGRAVLGRAARLAARCRAWVTAERLGSLLAGNGAASGRLDGAAGSARGTVPGSGQNSVPASTAVNAQDSKAVGAGGGKRQLEPAGHGADALTPAELRIARLVASGLSNRQIAERLYLSGKTIETHLSHVYRKLDVTSRTQLALRLTLSRPPAAVPGAGTAVQGAA